MARFTAALIPTIDSERLHLRGHTPEDFEAFAAMWADPAVVRYISGKPSTREESWSRLLRYVGHWALMGYGFWLIEERGTGRLVGETGYADFKRDVEPSLAGMPEIGWAIAPWAHGKGYGSEAVRAAVKWGDGYFGARSTACMIDPQNTPSLRIAEKCGYKEFARTTYKGAPTVLFKR